MLAHETKGIFASLLLSADLKEEYYLWSPVYPLVYGETIEEAAKGMVEQD